MIQRYIFTALTDGLAAIASDPEILDDIFVKNWGLEQSEVDQIKTLFSEKPPGIQHGYPRADKDFPMYNIILGDEKEDQHVLGDVAGVELEGELLGSDYFGSIMGQNYIVFVISEHPDATIYYYEVAKYLLMQDQTLFKETIHVQYSGRDIAPDPRYLPAHLFVRQLVVNTSVEFLRIDRESRLTKAYKVGGMHIDKNGSPSDVGEVNTNMSIYAENED